MKKSLLLFTLLSIINLNFNIQAQTSGPADPMNPEEASERWGGDPSLEREQQEREQYKKELQWLIKEQPYHIVDSRFLELISQTTTPALEPLKPAQEEEVKRYEVAIPMARTLMAVLKKHLAYFKYALPGPSHEYGVPLVELIYNGYSGKIGHLNPHILEVRDTFILLNYNLIRLEESLARLDAFRLKSSQLLVNISQFPASQRVTHKGALELIEIAETLHGILDRIYLDYSDLARLKTSWVTEIFQGQLGFRERKKNELEIREFPLQEIPVRFWMFADMLRPLADRIQDCINHIKDFEPIEVKTVDGETVVIDPKTMFRLSTQMRGEYALHLLEGSLYPFTLERRASGEAFALRKMYHDFVQRLKALLRGDLQKSPRVNRMGSEYTNRWWGRPHNDRSSWVSLERADAIDLNRVAERGHEGVVDPLSAVEQRRSAQAAEDPAKKDSGRWALPFGRAKPRKGR